VHPLQFAGIGQFCQIATNRLVGDTEVFGKPVDRDLAVAARDFKNIGLAKCL